MKTMTGAVAAGVAADLFAGTGGLIVGGVLVLVIGLAAAAIFSRRDEPAERLVDLVHGRAPRDPPSRTSPTRTSRHS